ncbi:hypothetical protein Hanom_Chr09g00864031 [Helianthus anomalus]
MCMHFIGLLGFCLMSVKMLTTHRTLTQGRSCECELTWLPPPSRPWSIAQALKLYFKPNRSK